MNFAVGAIFKNEDQYLLEWLAFHKVVGFSRFLIADNGSTDSTARILHALAESEPITVLDYPDKPDQRPQLGAYNALVRMCPRDVDAVAFIDADEFIVPTDGSATVTEALAERFSDPDVGAVALNWACFGSSGHRFQDDGLVIERFLKRSKNEFPINTHYKTVVRPGDVANWESPHHANLSKGRHVDMLGRDIVFREKFSHSLSREVVWDRVRINHYVVKSLEEFVLRKSPKGSASKEGRVKHKAYFERHDKNDVKSEEMLVLLPAVKAEIERLTAIVDTAVERDDAASGLSIRSWASTIKSALVRS